MRRGMPAAAPPQGEDCQLQSQRRGLPAAAAPGVPAIAEPAKRQVRDAESYTSWQAAPLGVQVSDLSHIAPGQKLL